MKGSMKIRPISIGILMILYTSIVFLSTMLVYWLMLTFSFILMILVKKKKAFLFLMVYIILMVIINIISKCCIISGWIGSLYTMGLIILKLFPLWNLAAIISNFSTSTMIHSLRLLHLPNSLCIGVAIFFRFIPEYREYLSEIKEGLKARNMGLSVLRSEEHTSELQSRQYLVCRLLLEKKKQTTNSMHKHKSRSIYLPSY